MCIRDSSDHAPRMRGDELSQATEHRALPPRIETLMSQYGIIMSDELFAYPLAPPRPWPTSRTPPEWAGPPSTATSRRASRCSKLSPPTLSRKQAPGWPMPASTASRSCLLYTSDAADEE